MMIYFQLVLSVLLTTPASLLIPSTLLLSFLLTIKAFLIFSLLDHVIEEIYTTHVVSLIG